jgi:hypothetical protein
MRQLYRESLLNVSDCLPLSGLLKVRYRKIKRISCQPVIHSTDAFQQSVATNALPIMSNMLMFLFVLPKR